MKQFNSRFGLDDVVVLMINTTRHFGNITAIKFEKDVIKYDILIQGMKLYDIQEYYLEIPSEHQDLTPM